MIRIRVALFETPAQAEPIRQRLSQAGIMAEVHNESLLAKLWFVSRKSLGARLEVPEKEAAHAGKLLAEWDGAWGALQSAIHCPECKSMQVDYPQFTPNSIFTNFAIGLVAAIGLVEREYYCEKCHCMWRKQSDRPRRIRRHMAPDYFLEDLPHEPLHGTVDRGGEAEAGSDRQGLEIDRSKEGVRRGETRSPMLNWWNYPAGMLALLGSQVGPIGAEAQAPPGSPIVIAAAEAEAGAETAVPSSSRSASAAAGGPTYLGDVLPILMGKCARCHNDQSPMMRNLLDYRTALAKRWEIKRRVWDSWKGTYFKQPMPTVNSPESAAITEEERATIRAWVKSGSVCGERPASASAQSKGERMEIGKRLFATICAACHQPGGQGIPGRFPPLAGSDFLNSDKQRAIKTVINGLQGEVTVNGQRFNNSMPRFPLSDEEIAGALTYVYNSFGNSGKDVSPAEVSAVRGQKAEFNPSGQMQSAKVPEEKSPYE